MKRRMSAVLVLMVLLLLIAPHALGAHASYDLAAMEYYCEEWTAAFKENDLNIKLDAYGESFPTMTIFKHGDYELYTKNHKDSIRSALSNIETAATYCLEIGAYNSEAELTLFGEYLTEIPERLRILISGGEIVNAKASTYVASEKSTLYSFDFTRKELSQICMAMAEEKAVEFEFTSNKGRTTVRVDNDSALPFSALVLMLDGGARFSTKGDAGYYDADLLPGDAKGTVTPKPTAKPTPKPTASSNVPSSLRGRTFSEGDSGNQVLAIKQRMQDLGYFRPTATLSSEYNTTMTQRVEQFQENNWLTVNGRIDSATLEKLYSSSAKKGQFYVAPTPKPTPEPAITLVFPEKSNGQWKELSGNRMNFRVQVKNTSNKRKIVAFELYVYTEDIWGERDPEEGRIYTVTTTKEVGPRKTVYSDYFTLENRKEISRVYVAISKVRYSDGTIEKDYSPEYIYWRF